MRKLLLLTRCQYFICILFLCLVSHLSSCKTDPDYTVQTLRRILEIPYYSPQVKADLLETWERRDLVFERVRFQGRYGEWVPALISYSKLALFKSVPAIICMPGIPSKKEDLMELSSLWADRGFFIISIDRPYYGEREGNIQQELQEKGLLKIWGEVVYEMIRTLDYLESRPEVDSSRLGMLGLSMGGMDALITASLDTRLKVLVSVSGQMSWPAIFATNSWQKIFPGLPLTRKLVKNSIRGENAFEEFEASYPGFSQIDAAKIISLVAPRPLLLIGGAQDPVIPLEAINQTYISGLKTYIAYNSQDCLEKYIEPEKGHVFSSSMQLKALHWFDYWLKGNR